MQKQRKLTYDNQFEGHPINADQDKGYACNQSILSAIKRTLDASLEQSSKVVLVRYDIRFPASRQVGLNDNRVFKSFQADFNRHLSRHDLKPKYVAVRENDTSANPHYHVALTLDGQKIKNPTKYMQKAEAILARKDLFIN